MNNIHLDTKHQTIWLSYEYLRDKNIPEGSFMNWSKRNVCKRKCINGKAFINYDTIPTPTRSKLPTKEEIKAEYKREKLKKLEQIILARLKEAYSSHNVVKWRNEIVDSYELTLQKATEFARCAAVLEEMLAIEHDSLGNILQTLFYAFDQIYPGKYKRKNRLCMALKKAREEGVLSVAVDKRIYSKRPAKYGDLHKYWAEYLLSHNKGYEIVDAYSMLQEVCTKENVDTPCFSWFKRYYYANKNRIDQNRAGKTAYDKDNANYAKIIPALYAGDQWSIDGWRLPVFCKRRNEDGGMDYFYRYTLFAVLDTYGRKIVGYRIAESEDTETILKGLETAVKETGILPHEIVADNHSFNKTKEAGNIKEEFDKLGVTWTVDSNPRRKAILERTFRILGDKYFKRQYGYIGQGIRSKIKTGITQQELKDIYNKPENLLTYDQIVALTVYIIDQYNKSIRRSLGESPNDRYAKSEQPHSTPIDLFTRMTLFNRKTEHQVRNGQITIKRGQHVYEYQLPAEYSVQYNGKTVGVCYSDFDNIYLFDLETEQGICSVPQKMAIHGAIANQTEKDKEALAKNAGRLKGVNSKKRKQRESLFDSANSINPDAYEAINKITTPKDILESIRRNYELRDKMYEHGTYLETVPALPVIDEMLDTSMKPIKKENKHPFHVGNNEIKKITI